MVNTSISITPASKKAGHAIHMSRWFSIVFKSLS